MAYPLISDKFVIVRVELTKDDIRDLKSYVLRARYGVSLSHSKLFRSAFQEDLNLASEAVVNKKVEKSFKSQNIRLRCLQELVRGI